MLATAQKLFNSDEFTIEVISNGSFHEDSIKNYRYTTDVYVIRVNAVGLRLWRKARELLDISNDYTAWASAHKSFDAIVIADLGLDTTKGDVRITQACGDIFMVLYIKIGVEI